MRRQTPIANVLYNHLFPAPTSIDPPSFAAHLARNLVPEVRIEVATFFGHLNSIEARYPGLDYCHAPHRKRLGRFKHHKRLFDAFDFLGITYQEIQDFCCWEGTKWARERYEADENVVVSDTTGDDIGPFVDRRELREVEEQKQKNGVGQLQISTIMEETNGTLGNHPADNEEDMSDAESGSEDGEEEEEDEEEDHEMTETPAEAAAREHHMADLARRREQAINQRIIAAWEQGQTLPLEIEQYLKEQSENGRLPASLDLRHLIATNRANTGGYALLPNPQTSTARPTPATRAVAG
ncbi:hypothetical protein B0A50_00829 [Salinomyces thailandicus]|uniref:Uncharacterized protein n=1 Tax=Salinomyces thailandicus TaxID=706561 RepID=A0A4U0UF83_9PEZI|nr:hypothetical protein B0A50_00829 [Salinomyces thailandica]